MANTAKKFEFDEEEEKTAKEAPPYIDWQDFNRLQKRKGVPRPEDDSKDDVAADELEEVVLGKDFGEENHDDHVVLADVPSAARDEDNLLEDRETDTTAPSSERPGPKDDLYTESDTH